MYIELIKGKMKWFWKVKGGNGETVPCW